MNKFICEGCHSVMVAGDKKDFPGFIFDTGLGKWLHSCGGSVVCENCEADYRATYNDSGIKECTAVHYCKRQHIAIPDLLLQTDAEYKVLKERQEKNKKAR